MRTHTHAEVALIPLSSSITHWSPPLRSEKKVFPCHVLEVLACVFVRSVPRRELDLFICSGRLSESCCLSLRFHFIFGQVPVSSNGPSCSYCSPVGSEVRRLGSCERTSHTNTDLCACTLTGTCAQKTHKLMLKLREKAKLTLLSYNKMHFIQTYYLASVSDLLYVHQLTTNFVSGPFTVTHLILHIIILPIFNVNILLEQLWIIRQP